MWENEVTKVIQSKNGFQNKILEDLKKRKGYGGTRLRSFLNWCQKNARNKLAIILTDGWTETDLRPEEFNIFRRTIFVLTPESNYQNVSKLKSTKIRILKMEKLK